MKRLLGIAAALALVVPLVACSGFQLFEDIGSDPHPPTVEILGVSYTPQLPPAKPAAPAEPTPPEPEPGTEPEPTVAEPEPKPVPKFLPADGFEIKLNDEEANSLVFQVRYTDAGADIVNFEVRDRDSKLAMPLPPKDPEVDLDGDGDPDSVPSSGFFPGTSGIANLEGIEFTSKMVGPHRIELWAEDGHGSRSPKVTFTFNVVFATR